MLHKRPGGGSTNHSQTKVTGTSNAGSPVTSPPLKLTDTVRCVPDAMQAASGGGQDGQLALRNERVSLNNRCTTALIGPAGRSFNVFCAHAVHAAAVPFNARSRAAVAPLLRGVPSEARHDAGLNAGVGGGATAGVGATTTAGGGGASSGGGGATTAGASIGFTVDVRPV